MKHMILTRAIDDISFIIVALESMRFVSSMGGI